MVWVWNPSRVPGLHAGKITSGTLDPNRVPNLVPNLDASKLTSGVLAIGRLPTDRIRGQSDPVIDTLKQARGGTVVVPAAVRILTIRCVIP